MTTNYIQQVQVMLKAMTFDNYKTPSEEQILSVLSEGRSRILKASSGTELCDLSIEFFPFCWSVVGRFGAASYNAVEIAALCGIQPIYIACAIHQYGIDWSHRLFTLKRLSGHDRGLDTVICGSTWCWSVRELRRRLPTSLDNMTNRQRAMRSSIKTSMVHELVDDVVQNSSLVLSVVEAKRIDVFRDPRRKPKLVDVKNPNAMTVVSKTEKQKLHELAVHPYPVDKSRPSTGQVRRIRGGGCTFMLPN